MAESPTQPQQFKRTPKFDRIDIWRTEVSSSRIYCACSAPATPAQHPVDETGVSSVSASPSASASSTAVSSANQQGTPSMHPLLRDQSRPTFLPRIAKSRSAPHPLSDEQTECPVCSSPIDEGVAYISFKEDGSGLVRTLGTPRSETSVKPLEEGGPAKDKKPAKRFFKAVSGVFKGSKSLDLSKTSRSPTRTQSRNDLIRQDHDTAERQQEGGNMAWTEMYRLLRREEKLDGTGDDGDGSVQTLGGLSDDRRKPQLTLDATAARLRRAQKLLGKNSRRNP